MTDLKLLKFPTSKEERIQSMITRFQRELIASDGEMDLVVEMLQIIERYLCEYDDPFLAQAYVHVGMADYFVDCWDNRS